MSPALQGMRRRSHIDRVLVRHGLIRGPRSTQDQDRAEPAVRLKRALAELGPVAALFARYLSTRMDVFPVSDAVCLQDQPLLAEPGPAPLHVLESRFATVDPRPCRVSLAWVAHRALTHSGRSVEVRWFNPELRSAIQQELSQLGSRLKPLLSGKPWGLPSDRLWAEFYRHELEPRLDLGRQRESWLTLASEAQPVDGLRVPTVDVELSDHRMLVLHMPDLASSADESAGRHRARDRALRRRATVAWVQLALTGGLFPIAAQWALGVSGDTVLVDGTFVGFAPDERPKAWDYLRAVARREPDRALGILLRALDTPAEWGEEEQERALRSRFRYMVPFRDGHWTLTGESLSELAAHQWHACGRQGFRGSDPWTGFFRALILRSRESAEPDRDVVREALDTVQWRAGWNQLRTLTEPRTVAGTAERYGFGLLDLPQALDRLLDVSDPDRADRRDPADRGHRGHRGTRAPGGSVLPAIAGGAMGLVALALAIPTLESPLLQTMGTVTFSILGVLVLILALRGD